MSGVTDWVMALVPVHGLWVLALSTFLSCLAIPMPASLVMLTGGAFAAAGDLVLWQAATAAFGGAVLGDQAGFWVARRAGPPLLRRLSASPSRAKVIGRVRGLLQDRGDWAVFLTRWLFSALGPWLNFVAGAADFTPGRFLVMSALGEALWVALYLGTGFGFAANLGAATELLGSALGFLAGLGAMIGLGWWLRVLLRRSRGRTA
ncbi:MAG: DedA family protein [Pseudomonadota bacterium]